jgi:peptidyl-prolyl cis-trans isomerase B (cyclophilin B)
MDDRTKLFSALGIGAVLALIVAAVLIAGGGDDAPPAVVVKQENLDPPSEVVARGEAASVVMETSEGTFTIQLDTDRAPKTANNFAYLAEQGFYDNLGFHRIVPDFVIQGGDPLGDGSGGPGYKVVEAPPKDLKYVPGIVAMAKSQAEASGTSGSQFFIVTGKDAEAALTPDYALVGRVSDGMDVVEAIGALGGADEQPTKTVVIEKATLEKG